MLELFYSTPYGRARQEEGPFGRHIHHYAALLVRSGYPRGTAVEHFEVLSRFGRWMQKRGWGVRQYNEQAIESFLRPHSRRQRWKLRPPLETFLKELRKTGIVKTRKSRASSRERIANAFQQYLKEERGLSPETITYYVAGARNFMCASCGRGCRPRIRMLSAGDITRYAESVAHEHHNYVDKLMPSLRAFLRFLFVQNRTREDLGIYLPSGTRWRPSELPPTLEPAEVTLLLRHCPRETPKGRRDYAVLLLLARLGLRGGEVTRLELDDIDWEKGEITVHGKGRHLATLPLPHEVGQALANYLKYGRPTSDNRRVFLRMRAPFIGWTFASAVTRIVKRALQRAGLRPSRMGSHLLRHTLATHLVRKGKSLSEIGQILRHRDLDTTAGYSKLDLRQLRIAAARWPGATA